MNLGFPELLRFQGRGGIDPVAPGEFGGLAAAPAIVRLICRRAMDSPPVGPRRAAPRALQGRRRVCGPVLRSLSRFEGRSMLKEGSSPLPRLAGLRDHRRPRASSAVSECLVSTTGAPTPAFTHSQTGGSSLPVVMNAAAQEHREDRVAAAVIVMAAMSNNDQL
jgi:hypothetical protein